MGIWEKAGTERERRKAEEYLVICLIIYFLLISFRLVLSQYLYHCIRAVSPSRDMLIVNSEMLLEPEYFPFTISFCILQIAWRASQAAGKEFTAPPCTKTVRWCPLQFKTATCRPESKLELPSLRWVCYGGTNTALPVSCLLHLLNKLSSARPGAELGRHLSNWSFGDFSFYMSLQLKSWCWPRQGRRRGTWWLSCDDRLAIVVLGHPQLWRC